MGRKQGNLRADELLGHIEQAIVANQANPERVTVYQFPAKLLGRSSGCLRAARRRVGQSPRSIQNQERYGR